MSELYQRAAMAMDWTPVVRVISAVLVTIGIYLAYVGWLAEPASQTGKSNP
jgi:hypothetical protein